MNIFKRLEQGIAAVGDIYLTFSRVDMGLVPAKVIQVDKDSFYYLGKYSSGKHTYGQSGGILLKEYQGKLELYAEADFLNFLNEYKKVI